MPSRSFGASVHPPRWPGLLLALAGSIAFSGKAIIVKLAYRHGVDPVTLIMYRMLFALPLFVVMAWWAGRGQAALTRRELLALLGLGFSGYYLASLLDFMGLALISASLERLILYLNPTIVLGLSVLFLGKKVNWRQALALGVSYAGVVLVFGQELNVQGEGAALGAALVFGSALSYAVYLVMSGQWVKRLGSMRLAGWAGSIACLFCIAHFLAFNPLSAARVAEPVLWLSLLNATACTVAPVWMVMMAIERIGPTLASQAGMVGPMSTITMGVVFLGEPFTPLLVAGTALVLTGVWLLASGRAG
ncbi:MAG TPA: DMT family transporter [Ideonella sp.]|nr:DMT family transporter [Ideonella sp.]HJV70517.1 DMT family transporter [Ideonella sp.]